LPTGEAALLSSGYWIITAYGTTGAFSANLTFTVPLSFTANGSENASTYTLYYRAVDDDASWVPLVTGASSLTATTITFNGIISLGQFMIGSSDGSLHVQTTGYIPTNYALYQNYPNPFNPSTTIQFDLKEESAVVLDIYNVLGQRVMEENYGQLVAGRYNEVVSMDRFASGVYFYRLRAGTFNQIKKMSLIK
jgi:hypothetical protein